uniref:long-chain-fatty-acid--CoA ligase n=1 Tax=Dermatophagoides pteronyssinus TaxID=6956 RepID=A0A6P6Y5Y9_DERPT
MGVRVYEWVEILEAGVQHRDTQEVIAKPDSVSCICFTSGTSGVPKGAMLTERMLVATISGRQGELAIRGAGVFPGYFCNEEASRECFDEEGFFHTGDIAEIFDGNRVRIIDRKKNLFKLSQGEYVSPEKVET